MAVGGGGPRKMVPLKPKGEDCFKTVGQEEDQTDRFPRGPATWKTRALLQLEQRRDYRGPKTSGTWGALVGGGAAPWGAAPGVGAGLNHHIPKHSLPCRLRTPSLRCCRRSVDGQVKTTGSYLSDDGRLDGPDLVAPGAGRFLRALRARRFLRQGGEGILVGRRVTLFF